MIEPSTNQTKEWRCNQPWYINGKHNECEKYQIGIIEKTTGKKIYKTNKRINLNTGELGKKDGNIFEWTENFGCQENIYFNLKMVCGTGGAQTRTLREVYHFILAQLKYLNKEPNSNIFFVNILDGEESGKRVKLFPTHKQIFVGSLFEWVKDDSPDDIKSKRLKGP